MKHDWDSSVASAVKADYNLVPRAFSQAWEKVLGTKLGRLHEAFSPISTRRLCHADETVKRPKQLSMASTARDKVLAIW